MSKELMSFVEKQAEKAENLSFCRGMKLLHVREQIEEILSHIGKMGLFEEYTIHDIRHIDEMLNIVEWIIPEKTKQRMTHAEWLMITLAVYFHDLGMVVTKEEYEKRNNSDFKQFKQSISESKKDTEYIEYVQNHDDVFLYQEYVRKNHAKRIRQWLEGKTNTGSEGEKAIVDIIKDILSNVDKLFILDLALICESHHKDDIGDFSKYSVRNAYGNDKDEKVNVNYIAIILRIADLLQITKDRTPSITRRLINVSNPTSVIEWEKQQAVRAICPQLKRDENSNINDEIEKDTIEVVAYFEGAETAEAYFGLSSYLQYTRTELKKCHEITEKARKQEGTEEYLFPWSEIDESKITVIGFETKKLQFTIAQENILNMLVGHTLYNDSSVVVRELVQNALDAVRLQNEIEKKNNGNNSELGRIQVDWNEQKRELCFWDNGTGMTIFDVENYLLKVGASKYRENEIKKEYPNFTSISHFGIGILTCFMIANDIDILTNSESEREVNCINLRKVTGSYLLSKREKSDVDERIRCHGTMVKLYVRPDVDMSNLEYDLKKWIVLPEKPVYLTFGEKNETRIGCDNLKDILKGFMAEHGMVVDGEKYDVYEVENGNVSIAYAVKYMKYLSDWVLLEIDRRWVQKKTLLPIGTCIEGIRVEFTTPGYKNRSILAVANIKNSDFQTNVARSALELESNSVVLSDIYDAYTQYIQNQMEQLEQIGYSTAWAVYESRYLMNPILPNEISNDRVEPVDENILINSLSKLKCIVLESAGKRSVVSAEDVYNMDEINVYDSKMMQAAENLLKEIRSEASLNDIVSVVCNQNNFLNEQDNIFCNYNPYNVVHQYAMSNKEVSSIAVDHEQRRIKLTYSKNTDRLWSGFEIRYSGSMKNIYIPTGDFEIEGLKDEVGVKTHGAIYINSGTELCEYAIKMIDIFRKEETEENKILLEIFLSCVFDARVLEQKISADRDNTSVMRQLMERRHLRVSEEMLDKMWTKVNMEEFSRIVLTKNFSLYSIDNWSRKVEDE